VFGRSKKEIVLGNMMDKNNRECVAVKKDGDLIIHVKANKDDIYHINNYIGNYSNKASYKGYSGQVVEQISRSLEQFYEENKELTDFIENFIYHYRVVDCTRNPYEKFLKDNIMFSYILEVVTEHRDGNIYIWKKIN
jgi:hypothetical protein